MSAFFEVARLLGAASCLKHQAALSVAYGAGLGAAEVTALKVRDVDSERMLLRVERGKDGRYRNAMLPTGLLALLREWWRVGYREGVLHVDGWLFPGQHYLKPLSTRPFYRVVVEAGLVAGIDKRIGPHNTSSRCQRQCRNPRMALTAGGGCQPQQRPEPVPPKADRLVANVNATLEQQVLDVRSNSGKRTYISTTSRITSGDELKRLNGEGGLALDLRGIRTR